MMSSRVKDMTVGTPGKLIVSFALPLMAGNIFQQLYTIVDTMVVGRFLGVQALAALGADDWFGWMMLGIVQGFAQGFAIKMSQEFGARNYQGLRKVIGNSAVVSIVFSLLLVILGELAVEPGLHLLHTQSAVWANAVLYLRIYFLGTPIVMLYNLFASILRSLGDSKTPLHAMIVASVTNIGLDLLFVVIFRWGIAGAAWATLTAQMISALYCFLHMRKMELLKLTRNEFRLDTGLMGHLFYLGLPMALQNVMIAIGGMIVQSVINAFSVAFIAGITAVNKMYGLLEIAATSYGYAMVTYAGQNLGAGNLERIRKGVKSALIISLITSAMIAAAMLLCGKGFIGLFISGTENEVKEAVNVGHFYLNIMSICLPILYCLHVVRSTIQGLGNTMLPMISGLVEFFMRTSVIYLLPMLIGEIGVYFAEVSAWIGAVCVLIPSYVYMIKKFRKQINRCPV